MRNINTSGANAILEPFPHHINKLTSLPQYRVVNPIKHVLFLWCNHTSPNISRTTNATLMKFSATIFAQPFDLIFLPRDISHT